jgi:phospho-N-acetylmuramoyl-pentapeptide-transferase
MGVVAFLVTLVVGGPYVEVLRRLRIGKRVRVEGPTSHLEKMGTPTMGGLMISGTGLVVTLGVTAAVYTESGRSILLPAFVLISCGILGALDDWLTLVGKRSQGVTVRFKFAWLTAIAVVAALGLYLLLGLDFVFVPTVVGAFHLGPLYIPLAMLAIIATANAVNLTDGLDSLAGWTAAISFVAYGIISLLYGNAFLLTFCFIMVGALFGFLWYNAHPALVFMGDTGSLAIGATLAVVSLMLGQVLLLPIIGFVFAAEALSVILQVVFFKLTRGKRLFRMAPLHHHFELMGWSETHVTQRFWLVSILASMLGVALALV